VASEVRSLAQRSSTAAKEIKELISASVQTIRDGSELAGEAGKTMSDVTQAVARVTDI
ncbi:methyl-accepting chemotaxis protein, partial [Burkholderia contaminans]